jgi:hypothetical protein
MAKLLLQLITYGVLSEYSPGKGNIKDVTNVRTCLLSLPVPASGLMVKLIVIYDYAGEPDIPRVCRISSVDALPSTRSVSRITLVLIRIGHAHLPLLPACY